MIYDNDRTERDYDDYYEGKKLAISLEKPKAVFIKQDFERLGEGALRYEARMLRSRD